MEAVITKELALKAILHGACKAPPVGKKISSLSTAELVWAEDKKIATQRQVKKVVGVDLPVWVLSANGDGYGNGYGYGYGYGYGNGYGYGYGDGDGDGYGYGDGYGNGYGYGYGDGYGYGYGNGDGNGYGNGDGYGYGYGLDKQIQLLSKEK